MTTFFGHPAGNIIFTHREIEAIQSALKNMLNGDIPHLNLGICFNLERSVKELGMSTESIRYYKLVSLLSMDWEYHRTEGQSHTAYPVPYTDYQWKGEGLTYRISLIKHLLMKIEEKMAQEGEIFISLGNWKDERVSLKTLRDIQKEAKELLRKARAGELKNISQGICGLLIDSIEGRHTRFTVRMVGTISKRWPRSAYFGTFSLYPIQGAGIHTWEKSPWTGKTLEYRIDLLKYIIKRLKDTIRRAEKNGKATII